MYIPDNGFKEIDTQTVKYAWKFKESSLAIITYKPRIAKTTSENNQVWKIYTM